MTSVNIENYLDQFSGDDDSSDQELELDIEQNLIVDNLKSNF